MGTQMMLLLPMLLCGECEHECNERLPCILKVCLVVKGPAAFVRLQYAETQSIQPW